MKNPRNPYGGKPKEKFEYAVCIDCDWKTYDESVRVCERCGLRAMRSLYLVKDDGPTRTYETRFFTPYPINRIPIDISSGNEESKEPVQD